MACILYKGEEERQFQYIVDANTDINSLPTSTTKGANGEDCISIGSMALSIASGNIYVLDSSNTWTKVGG